MEKPLKIVDVRAAKKQVDLFEVVDQYDNLLDELFQIRNPWTKMKKDYAAEFAVFKQEHLAGKSSDEAGQWFYFPWSKTLVHYLTDELHQEVRTARNKNIITKEEQGKLYATTVAVAGLSVGSHGALTMAMIGMARHMKLADPDTISASNLNRLSYDFTKIGKHKAEVAAQTIYQINPYAEIEVFLEGVTNTNIDDFLTGVDILIEEMDSLPLKVMIRKESQKRGIPVLMATDNGVSVILDIERFDEEPQRPLFHGRVELSEETLSPNARQTNPKLWNQISSKIIGVEYMEEGLLTSLAQIGQTLGGVPQLGSAAVISGGLIAISASRIATKKPLPSGKYIFSTEAILVPDYQSAEAVKRRDDIRAQFNKSLEV